MSPGTSAMLRCQSGVTVAEPDTGRVVVNNVSLDVHEGEIVCLYGLMGAGRTELMEALAGRDPIAGGASCWVIGTLRTWTSKTASPSAWDWYPKIGNATAWSR